ncbi:hypothetical protein IWX46DRAFT_31124 [Phyllosticta citricarpa]|uniref:Uncharacterized protein n=1 Tax=Phyllosticta citricarpa TaxID=55181 RepID=A0ABR1MRK2_9PEZI
MRHFLTAGLTLAAASTVAAAPAAASAPPANGDPATLNYAVANFYAYWSLGHVLEAAFEIKEKDTDKFVAYCTGKVPSSISPPPDNQPSSLGNCVSLDRESTISATVGGDPGTNLLIYVKDDKSIPTRARPASVPHLTTVKTWNRMETPHNAIRKRTLDRCLCLTVPEKSRTQLLPKWQYGRLSASLTFFPSRPCGCKHLDSQIHSIDYRRMFTVLHHNRLLPR